MNGSYAMCGDRSNKRANFLNMKYIINRLFNLFGAFFNLTTGIVAGGSFCLRCNNRGVDRTSFFKKSIFRNSKIWLILMASLFSYTLSAQTIQKITGDYCAGSGTTFTLMGVTGTCTSVTWSVLSGVKGTHYDYYSNTGSSFNINWLTPYTYGAAIKCTYSCGGTTGDVYSSTITILASTDSYTVDGGGTYCANTGGGAVTLSGSAIGIDYQLLKNGINYGDPISGTGYALSWDNLNEAGHYTVKVPVCPEDMSGSATISILSADSPLIEDQIACNTSLEGEATGSITASDGYDSYIWYLDGYEQSGATGQTYNYNIYEDAEIGVKGIKNGCTSTAISNANVSYTGIMEASAANGRVFVTYQSDQNIEIDYVEIEVFNPGGASIFTGLMEYEDDEDWPLDSRDFIFQFPFQQQGDYQIEIEAYIGNEDEILKCSHSIVKNIGTGNLPPPPPIVTSIHCGAESDFTMQFGGGLATDTYSLYAYEDLDLNPGDDPAPILIASGISAGEYVLTYDDLENELDYVDDFTFCGKP